MSNTKLPAHWRRAASRPGITDPGEDWPEEVRVADRQRLFEMVPGIDVALEKAWEIVLNIVSETKVDGRSAKTTFRVDVFANGMLLHVLPMTDLRHARESALGIARAAPTIYVLMRAGGTSGSTGWSNSVRSRLYLERVTRQRKRGNSTQIIEPDTSARRLTVKKANHAATGGFTRLRWVEGVFELDGRTLLAGSSAD